VFPLSPFPCSIKRYFFVARLIHNQKPHVYIPYSRKRFTQGSFFIRHFIHLYYIFRLCFHIPVVFTHGRCLCMIAIKTRYLWLKKINNTHFMQNNNNNNNNMMYTTTCVLCNEIINNK